MCVCGVFRLVSGAGDIKLTKDGNVLLHEMVCDYYSSEKKISVLYQLSVSRSFQQIQHPTASLIARVATAQVSYVT